MKTLKQISIYTIVFIIILILTSSFVAQGYMNESFYTSVSPKKMYYALTGKFSEYVSGVIQEDEKKKPADEEKEPSSYKLGDSGDKVLELQLRLYYLDFITSYPDGNFGQSTETAVKAYQKSRGLKETGVLNSQTITSLKSEVMEYSEGKRGKAILKLNLILYYTDYLSEYPTEEFNATIKEAIKTYQKNSSIEITGSYNTETQNLLNSVSIAYKEGKTGEVIEKYQKILKELGYLLISPDGSFGEATTEAVKTYQKLNGLTQNGTLDEATRKALDRPTGEQVKPEA